MPKKTDLVETTFVPENMAIAIEADVMLALLRGGAPNSEVLMARSIDELVAIAERHKISISLPSARTECSDDGAEGMMLSSASTAAGGFDSALVSGRGGCYEGERNEQGQWEGFGTYTFTDGSVYEGQWRANRQEGFGTFFYASGNRYEGQWKAGKKDGHGTFGYADGRVEVGTYVEDKDVGEGAMWSPDRRIAWRILQDGLEVAEITLEEAKRIADRIGEPVPAPGDWLAARRTAEAAATARAEAEAAACPAHELAQEEAKLPTEASQSSFREIVRGPL